jgi:hypothetical protein
LPAVFCQLLVVIGLPASVATGFAIDVCIANDPMIPAGARKSGLPLEALRSLAAQGSIIPLLWKGVIPKDGIHHGATEGTESGYLLDPRYAEA